MPRCMPLDRHDRAVLRALDDDFSISDDGETAKLTGQMEIEIVRPADDGGTRLRWTFKLPGGEPLTVRIARAQLLQELGIKDDGEGAPS
jgi:hypothetical protein